MSAPGTRVGVRVFSRATVGVYQPTATSGLPTQVKSWPFWLSLGTQESCPCLKETGLETELNWAPPILASILGVGAIESLDDICSLKSPPARPLSPSWRRLCSSPFLERDPPPASRLSPVKIGPLVRNDGGNPFQSKKSVQVPGAQTHFRSLSGLESNLSSSLGARQLP